MFREYPRLRRLGLPTYKWEPDEVHLHEEFLEKPLHWKLPRMIFTNSMSDFFHEKIPFDFLDRVMEIAKSTPQHTYQILTKRSKRMMRYCERIGSFPQNVWVGVSVESASCKSRVDDVKEIRARIRFVSFEPLLGPLGELDLSDIQWVIVGGESGPNHRSCKMEWVREIRDQCVKSSIPLFFKQWGGARPASGGRLLDGREWNQFPYALPPQLLVEVARRHEHGMNGLTIYK